MYVIEYQTQYRTLRGPKGTWIPLDPAHPIPSRKAAEDVLRACMELDRRFDEARQPSPERFRIVDVRAGTLSA